MALNKKKLDELYKALSGFKDTVAANPGDFGGLTDAQKLGAAGRTEGASDAELGKIGEASEAGVPMAALGDENESGKTNLQNPGGFVVPTLSKAQSSRYVQSFGLEGILDSNSFSGLTAAEANKRGQEERNKRRGQISQLSSFAFNPETLTRTQRAIDKLGFALDDVDNDPFEPKEFKDENRNNTLDITSREIGQLFNDPNDLLEAYQTNAQFKSTIDGFIEKGGSLEGISKNITAPVVGEGAQDEASFLANLSNPLASQEAEQKALDELMPESEIAQAEIARVGQIPDDLKTLYFGDEKTIGLLEMQQEQSKAEIKLLEEQAKDAKRTARERSSLMVEKNNAEVKQQKAKIEENRLRAKNYMTGALAKLGALKTTGAAPQALQIIETKYQGQVTQLETAYQFANREIEIDLDESIDSIDNHLDELTLDIQRDLTKDTETVTKEILKAQQAAEKETYRITEQYARRIRTRTTKYTEDLKKAAEKYAKAFAKTASGDLKVNSFAESAGEGAYLKGKGVLLPDGSFSDLRLTPTQQQEVQSANVFGDDTMRYFLSLPSKFREELARGALSSGTNLHTVQDIEPLFAEWQRLQDDDGGGDSDDIF